MEQVADLIKWLKALPKAATVGIDEAGLSLECYENGDTYELGGMPYEEEE